jgi:hypothetical protein
MFGQCFCLKHGSNSEGKKINQYQVVKTDDNRLHSLVGCASGLLREFVRYITRWNVDDAEEANDETVMMLDPFLHLLAYLRKEDIYNFSSHG